MSDLEVFREVDEDYRQEQMVKFWKRWGGWVAAAFVVVMAAAYGVVFLYQRAEDHKAVLTADLDKLITEGKPGEEAKIAEALAAYAAKVDPSHAVLARLAEASLRQRIGMNDAAAALYHRVADDGDAPQDLRDLAIVRLGVIAVDQAKPEPILPKLQELVQKKSPWSYSARETIALLTAKEGKNAEAVKLLDELIRDPMAPPDMVGRARILADLYRGK